MTTKILQIEDDEVDVMMMQRICKKLGLDVQLDVMQDGKVALDHIVGMVKSGLTAPDLIVLDLSMPRMTGAEFLAELRALKPNDMAAIPVFVLTGSNMQRDREEIEQYGILELFVKGDDMKEFSDHLSRFCKDRAKSS